MSNSIRDTETQIEVMHFYNQTRDEYEDAKGLVHGLMKDGIQNGFGHRENIKHATDWGMEIELIEDKDRTLVTITDHGTTGLIGDIHENIKNVPSEVRVDPEQKLARFEKILNSGTNVSGAAGSMGRGNLVYQFNSDEDKIMWDSLRPDQKYVANRRKQNSNGTIVQAERPYLDKEAHRFIAEQAGLEPLKKPGTRITIFSPSDELITKLKDGTFAKYIGNTWFEMLGILGEFMEGIYIIVNGKKTKVELPEHWKKYFNDDYEESNVYKMDHVKVRFSYKDPDTGSTQNPVTGRAAKIVYVLADEDLDEDQQGIVVNRSYMAINQIKPIIDSDLPPDAKKRVFGYVKLESSPVPLTGKSYEEMIKVTETAVHYGFGLKQVFTNLKNEVMSGAETFKRRAGIVSRSTTHTARRTRLAVNRAVADINEYLGGLGVNAGGPGDHRSDFLVSLEKIKFPSSTSMVLIGQSVDEIGFRLKNKTPNNQTVKLVVDILDKDRHDTIEVISEDEEILINSYNHALSENYSINFSEEKYRSHNLAKIYIRATIKDENGEKLAYKIVPVYLGHEPDDTSDKPIVVYEPLTLPNSNGRVDIGDKIEAVNCLVKNETGFEWELKLQVGVLHPESDEWIETLIQYGDSFVLGPYTEETFVAGEISFDEEKYGHIDEGKLLLRAKLVSATDQHNNNKGDELSMRNQTLWLNTDPPGRGLFKVETKDGLPSELRCKVEGSNGSRTLIVNRKHPSYTVMDDDDLKVEVYAAELCLFEGMKYCWQNNYEAPFGIVPSDDIPFDEAILYITKAYDTGLEIYHGS
jgi:hypothetical protein